MSQTDLCWREGESESVGCRSPSKSEHSPADNPRGQESFVVLALALTSPEYKRHIQNSLQPKRFQVFKVSKPRESAPIYPRSHFSEIAWKATFRGRRRALFNTTPTVIRVYHNHRELGVRFSYRKSALKQGIEDAGIWKMYLQFHDSASSDSP